MFLKSAAATAVALMLAAGSASAADILASVTPSGDAVTTYQNKAGGQNFLVQFTLADAADITGFDLWTDPGFGQTGQDVTIRIRADDSGSPESTNLDEFASIIDTRTDFSSDSETVGAHFSAVSLAAGTYWIGMSGTSQELGWQPFNLGVFAPSTQRQLSGESVESTPSIESLAFAVEGTTVPGGGVGAPEPAAWALLLLGFGGVGVALRRRQLRLA
ncbi:MAG TPA: PEPxxWA-CTERM sorting domain-containing protein [Phenylobacterium sp.]|jgi:hypothetical protein|uniref:PEPxxWA-CTERM sorting domain-containing protein n=1 Tax=Phenylobacterium sp. TaxID=1871053 RepID=UPI002D55E8E5|nr:PEPxxWA-CTERM sorting domain-containing protein [Phenylobacterium sp.]HZZ66773.1 PEPxxWA-CTERM sorting domain-containing protein [Phenylobacterium sp.]